MNVWAEKNKKNTFANDFFWPNNSKEIWTTDMSTGAMKNITDVFSTKIYLLVLFEPPNTIGFYYEEWTVKWTRKYFG